MARALFRPGAAHREGVSREGRIHSSEPRAPGIGEETGRLEMVKHAGVRGGHRGGAGTALRAAHRPRSTSHRCQHADLKLKGLIADEKPRTLDSRSALRRLNWTRGARVQGNPNIAMGTAIAVFDYKGNYTNTPNYSHAAIYISQDNSRLTIVDQYPGRPPETTFLPWTKKGVLAIGLGSSYYIIMRK